MPQGVPGSGKPHWTQTPEGKDKLRKAMKKSWVTREANKNAKNGSTTPEVRRADSAPDAEDNLIAQAAAFACGRCLEITREIADSAGLPLDIVAERVAAGLRLHGRWLTGTVPTVSKRTAA